VGKLLSPARKRKAVKKVEEHMELSERRACRTLEQLRMTHRYEPKQPDRDKPLIAAMKRLAGKHTRYGYRFITAKLRQEGWGRLIISVYSDCGERRACKCLIDAE
jgi:putative transposase